MDEDEVDDDEVDDDKDDDKDAVRRSASGRAPCVSCMHISTS